MRNLLINANTLNKLEFDLWVIFKLFLKTKSCFYRCKWTKYEN